MPEEEKPITPVVEPEVTSEEETSEETGDTPPETGEGEEDDEEKVIENNRYQRLMRKLEEKDKLIESMQSSQSEEIKKAVEEAMKAAVKNPSAEQAELHEEIEEWFLEAFGDDDEGVSKKTYKEMKGFIDRISRKAIENYVSEFNKKQTEEVETTNKYKEQFQKEYDALVDEGMDRFPLEQILAHSKVMMEKRAKRLGIDFEEVEVPDMELVYNDLERLKPKVTKKKDALEALDQNGDNKGTTKKVYSLKELEKRRW